MPSSSECKIKMTAIACILFFVFALSSFAQKRSIPHLEKRGNATQLIVNGQPFLVLAGELHNSTATSTAYLKPIWKKLTDMHLNTVLAAITWELTEPEEGKYDFSLIDSVIADARKNNMRLSLLWFGSWKNGLSHYAPAWVKKDFKRFPRMRIKGNFPVEAITPISEAAMNADAKAFAAMMKHVKQLDEKQQTVIMIQVQNEVGLIGDSRGPSRSSGRAWHLRGGWRLRLEHRRTGARRDGATAGQGRRSVRGCMRLTRSCSAGTRRRPWCSSC